MKVGSVVKLATVDVKTIPPRSTVMNALKTMLKFGFRRMPIADAGTKKLMGIVTATDILDFFGGGEKHKIVTNRFGGNLARAVNEYVEEIMTRDVAYVRYTDSWQDAVEVMFKRGVGGCPILDDEDRIFGIITERDIVRFLSKHRVPDGFASDYMTSRVITIDPNSTIEDAMKKMISRRIRRLPVVRDGILMGVIVSMDILRYFGRGEAFRMIETGNVKDALSKRIYEIIMNPNVVGHRDPIIFRSRDRISDIVRRMVETGVGSALIVEDGRLEGIITERDLMKFLYSVI